ncbi:uncharacterized protein LOC120325876 isoform X2 [Styela clava]
MSICNSWWYSHFFNLLIAFCLSALTPVIADIIKVQDDESIFATNYTVKMDSIGIGATPTRPRYWSINNIRVYGVFCSSTSFNCFPQPVPPNDFIVTGSAVADSNSVNTTINMRYMQQGPLIVKIIDTAGSDLSSPVSIELKDCTNDTAVDDTNVNLALLKESLSFGESVVVACTTSEVTNVTLTCNMNATWTQTGRCPPECNWSGVTIPSTLERAVGAPAEFYVSNNNTLYNSTVFTWKLTSSSSSSTTTVLAELVHFSGSPGTFVPLSTPKRGATVSSIATSSTSSYHNLTFTPNLSDNGSNITLERDGCSAETKTSRPTTLDLRYGDTEHFGSSFVADKTRVEYNTTVTFSCDPAHYEPASFTAVLLADATWEPSDAPVTCTLTTTTSMTTIIATTEATVTDTTTEIPQSSTHGNVSNNNASLSLVTSLPTTTETNSNTTGDGSAERQACDVNFFRNAAPVNLNGICVDGCSVYFRCNDVSIAQNINFTRSCGRNGAWNNTSSPCLVFCPGLKDGELAGIAFVIIYASITLVWVYLVFDRNKNIKIAIKKTVLLGVCKFICWIIGIGLLFGATEDWCDLTGGNIAGIIFGVIAVLLGILYCFLNHKQFFDETPISAGTRVSPAPVPQNGETAPEQMEMNPEDSL